MDAAWISALTAFGGAVIGSVLTRNGDFVKWRREERHRAAAELLAATEAVRRTRLEDVVAVRNKLPAGDASARQLALLTQEERLLVAVQGVRLAFPRLVAEQAEDFARATRTLRGRTFNGRPIVLPKRGGASYYGTRDAFVAGAARLITPAPLSPLLRRRGALKRADELEEPEEPQEDGA